MQINDGLANMVSMMGTDRDKAASSQYYVQQLTDAEIVAAFKSSAVARRVVDMPAEDACRAWREWSADSPVVSDIEAEEKRLGVAVKIMRAQKLARLFGGAALLIGDGSRDPSKPLDPEMIGRGGLKYLTVLTQMNLAAGPMSANYASDDFGAPEYWMLNTAGSAGLRIHPSRLVVFHGVDGLGDYDPAGNYGWGDSVLQGAVEAIRRVDEVASNINSLVYEAKIDVVNIPDLMRNLASRGAEYEAEIIRRLTLAMRGKGINGTLILDGDETHAQKSASFSSLDAILTSMMQLASASAGIPMTLLFEMSAGGLSATGASDVRGYYDRVNTHQTTSMEPAMGLLDECLIRSATGSRDPSIYYNWRPLWQQTAKERAEIGKLQADTLSVLDAMEILPSEALGKAAVTALTESGAFAGLEAAVEEFGGGLDGRGVSEAAGGAAGV